MSSCLPIYDGFTLWGLKLLSRLRRLNGLGQALLPHLSRFGVRKGFHEDHVARHHEALELAAAPPADRVRTQLRIVFEHDVRAHGLSEHVVRDADDRGETNTRECVDRVFDFDRADLLATCLDDVVTTVDEVEMAVFVHGE